MSDYEDLDYAVALLREAVSAPGRSHDGTITCTFCGRIPAPDQIHDDDCLVVRALPLLAPTQETQK